MKKIGTWLPQFSGFYNTIWEPDETREIEYVNERRKELGLEPITFDDCEFDYATYNLRVVKGIASIVGSALKKGGYIKVMEFEQIVSPREYNFRNDSANVIVTLTQKNEKAIKQVLLTNEIKWAEWLENHYTSYSGFISSYPNTIEAYMDGCPLEDAHKLGMILQFICDLLIEDQKMSEELRMYEDLSDNGCTIEVTNYDELTTVPKRCNQCVALVINGVFCHEHGCPNTRKTWVEGEWITNEEEND